MTTQTPTIFHLTHWKAGSQWVAEILKHCAPERFESWTVAEPGRFRGYGIPDFYTRPLTPGRIYGTVYLPRGRFDSLVSGFFWRGAARTFIYPRRILTNLWNYRVRNLPRRKFLITRDLIDTLVSFYFSIRHSHRPVEGVMTRRRQILNGLTLEDGLIFLMDEAIKPCAEIQASWLSATDVLRLRFEDALGNEHAFFEQLIDYCEIEVDRSRLHAIVGYNVFEASTGRARGQEDIHAHLRKGIAGDWKNYFSDRVKQEFNRRLGSVLVETGYEKSLDW